MWGNYNSPPNCSSSTDVTNGQLSYNTQATINYDADGTPQWSQTDGIRTTVTRDQDERVTNEGFSPAGRSSYGNITYTYDEDGQAIDKGGTLAVVNLPAAVSTATCDKDDQVTNWGSAMESSDNASNLTTDGASGYSLGWSSRNEVSSLSATVQLTHDEVDGLMANLLVSSEPPAGHTLLSDWVNANAERVGVAYASEVARHFR